MEPDFDEMCLDSQCFQALIESNDSEASSDNSSETESPRKKCRLDEPPPPPEIGLTLGVYFHASKLSLSSVALVKFIELCVASHYDAGKYFYTLEGNYTLIANLLLFYAEQTAEFAENKGFENQAYFDTLSCEFKGAKFPAEILRARVFQVLSLIPFDLYSLMDQYLRIVHVAVMNVHFCKELGAIGTFVQYFKRKCNGNSTVLSSLVPREHLLRIIAYDAFAEFENEDFRNECLTEFEEYKAKCGSDRIELFDEILIE